MSDIVEMLVDAAGGNEAHVCAIAAAEIKRNLSQIEQLDARCGRLRDTCSTWERASNNYAEAVEIKDAEIERLRGTQCNWTDEGGDCWETDCGHGFQFNDGGPADNSFTHCPFCGGKLIVVQVDE